MNIGQANLMSHYLYLRTLRFSCIEYLNKLVFWFLEGFLPVSYQNNITSQAGTGDVSKSTGRKYVITASVP